MEPATIVILAPRITDDSVSIWRQCINIGWKPERLQGWRVPDALLNLRDQIVIYGEPLFAEAVADQLGLVLLEPSIDWLPNLPQEYVSRKVCRRTLREAGLERFPVFVKPAEGKVFEARVYDESSELPGGEQVDQTLEVLVSEIVDFRLEVRCIIRDRKLVTLSPYWRNDALAQNSSGAWVFIEDEELQARGFANWILTDQRIALPPACTLDIGRLGSGKWAVVEANPIWGAGLYGGDPLEILLSIRQAIKPKSKIDASDQIWISKRNG